MSNFDNYVINIAAAARDAQKVAELIFRYNTLLTLVEDMRKAQRTYNEMFPTGYECYAPTDLEKKVDDLIAKIRQESQIGETEE